MAKRANVLYTVHSIIRFFIKENNWPVNELCCQQGCQARPEVQAHAIRHDPNPHVNARAACIMALV
jgi:hypothetical protein